MSAHGDDANDGLTVLIVEDNPANQRVIALILEHLGHNPLLARDGGEALSVMDRQAVDLVLMDLHMPVMDGFAAAAAIRALRDARADVPILAVTADGSPGVQRRVREAGMDAYLPKPVDIIKLDAAMRACAALAGERPISRGA